VTMDNQTSGLNLCKIKSEAKPVLIALLGAWDMKIYYRKKGDTDWYVVFRPNADWKQDLEDGSYFWVDSSFYIYIYDEKIYLIKKSNFVSHKSVPKYLKWTPKYSGWDKNSDGTWTHEEYTGSDTPPTYWYGEKGWWEADFSTYSWKTLPTESSPLTLTGVGQYAMEEADGCDYEIYFEQTEWWRGSSEASLASTTDLGSEHSQLQMFGKFEPQGSSKYRHIVGTPIWRVDYWSGEDSEQSITPDLSYYVAVVNVGSSEFSTSYLMAAKIEGIPTNYVLDKDNLEIYFKKKNGKWSGDPKLVDGDGVDWTPSVGDWTSDVGFDARGVGDVVDWHLGESSSTETSGAKEVLKTTLMGYYLWSKEFYMAQLPVFTNTDVGGSDV